MDTSTHEQHLSQPLQTKLKQFKIAVIILSGYNGIFYVTNKSNKFYFTRPINVDDFSKKFIPPGAFEIDSVSDENKGNMIEEDYFTDANYPFTIKPNFSNLGSILGNFQRESVCFYSC